MPQTYLFGHILEKIVPSTDSESLSRQTKTLFLKATKISLSPERVLFFFFSEWISEINMFVLFIYALFSAVEETLIESIKESGDARCLDAQWWRMGLAQAKVKVLNY